MAHYDAADSVRLRLRRDTLIKSSVILDSSCRKTLADSVYNMVNKELRGHCHTADTGTFLNSILPLKNETVEKVYQQLVENGTYANHSWTNLPKDETKENGLYGPFVNVVNAINKACGDATGGVRNYWVDRHATSPRSRDKDAAAIRPDIVSILWDTEALKSLEKKMASLKKSIDEKGEATDVELKDFQAKVRVLVCHL